MPDAPLNVLLGGDAIPGHRTGVGRMALQLAQSLRGRPDIAELRLLVGAHACTPDLLDRLDQFTPPPDPEARANGARGLARRIPGLARARAQWLRRWLNREAAQLGAPLVYHEPNLIARPFDGVTVLTINDLSWLADTHFHPRSRLAWIESRLADSLTQATRFVAISHFTRDEMVRHLGIARERIDVVSLAPPASFRPVAAECAHETLARWGLVDQSFVLSVSTLEPRKNFDRLLAAHGELSHALRRSHPLVIAGGQGWGERLVGRDAAKAIRAGELRLLGRISDQDLERLYSRCAAFVFPSLYEGFGLPVIEAMACGAPVIASSTTAVGETAGNAAVLVDPLDVAALSEAIGRVLRDRSLAVSLADRGRMRAADFSWDATTALLLASWRRALAG
ncbi:MAG: glycosyltransferase family 4 protein [Alphaproteobacteria bacterium]|nr:glycosyltransferase family 4 protein [Alphaproteobacteria bacterium]